VCVLVKQRLLAHPALFACLYSPNKLDTLIETLFGTTSFITMWTIPIQELEKNNRMKFEKANCL